MITPTLSRSAAKTCVQFISGPVKVKDGLYMGDQIAAKDIDFIVSNKVTHIINTVVKKVPNLYQKYGVQYLSVNWTQKQQNIFDKKNNALNAIHAFIDEAMEQGQSVLVHSLHGKSRSGCVIIGYLMKKYNWSLQKSYDFIISKKDSFKLRSLFLNQLQQLQKRLSQNFRLTKNWNQYFNQEDILLANTFKNQKADPTARSQISKKANKKVSWGQRNVIASDHKINILTSTSKYKDYLGQSSERALKPILKNCKQFEQFNQQPQLDNIQIVLTNKNTINQQKQQDRLTKSQALGANKSYKIVNNYTNNEKLRQPRYASIPAKQEKKPTTTKSGSKLAAYQNVISSIRSPYDMNFINRIEDSSRRKTRQQYKEYLRNANLQSQSQQRPYPLKGHQSPLLKSYQKFTSNIREEVAQNYAKIRQMSGSQRQNFIRYK